MTVELPEPIAAYFDADRLDGDAVARCFAKDAVVKDEGHTYAGVEAIARWKNDASARYRYTSELLAAEPSDGATIVTCRLTGNFPGSPVDLKFRFRLERGRIASLEIAP